MKIAIISDTHDDLKNIPKFLEIARQEQFDAIIHCGDLCGPGVIRAFIDLEIPFYFTFGNVDTGMGFELTEKIKNADNIHIFKPFGEIELGGKKIAFVHYPQFAYGLCLTKKYDAVFYGHTHHQKKEKIENCWLVNPGEITTLHLFLHPDETSETGYAIYDTDNNEVELKKL